MRKFLTLALPILAFVGAWAIPLSARAAGGVTDDAPFFSAATVRQADEIITQNEKKGHHRDIRVVTVAAVPDELKSELESQGKNKFFEHWADNIGKRDKVDGVVILVCKDPSHIQIVVGNNTREKAFPDTDRRQLVAKLTAAFKGKEFDSGLLEAVRFIELREDANVPPVNRSTSVPPAVPPTYPTPSTPYSTPSSTTSHSTGFFSSAVFGFLCVGVVILIVVFIVMGAINRHRSYSGGYGAPPPGGYPPGYGGGYPQGGGGYFGGGGYGGGGSGFGTGLLGGLLGGAVGAWGYDKLTGRDNSNNPNYYPNSGSSNQGGGQAPSPGYTPNDPTDQPDTNYSGSGSDFGNDSSSSSGSDFGSSSDSSSGSDFGSSSDSGGGSDFGGGGGDSGSSGGDF